MIVYMSAFSAYATERMRPLYWEVSEGAPIQQGKAAYLGRLFSIAMDVSTKARVKIMS